MNPSTLITDNLDTWSSAIKAKSSAGRGGGKKQEFYGIKKLRELILELAVRGLLVPQDPEDEQASKLVERIAIERSKLIKQGKLKKQKALPRISKADAPFSIPSNWDWIRLGNATNYGVCDKAEASDADEDTWVLELEDVEKSTSKLLRKVRFTERKFRSSKNRFSTGDVIYGKLRPYLDKVIVADEPGVCTTEMIPISVYAAIEPTFLRLTLKSPYFIRYANDSTHGMNLPRMGTDKARDALIPIAPEKEQHRIVAKVDELMALCDQLEQQQEQSARTHGILVQTLLGALTSASERGQFEQAWQRIASNFDTLFTTESSIDQLKQTILQLAVMGKLVEQDAEHEPASDLLIKVAKERAKSEKSGKLKKQKPLPPISSDETPFNLPEQWVWCKFGLLGEFINGDRSKNYPHTSEYVTTGMPWINTGHIEPDGTLTKSSMNYITKEKFDSLRGGKVEPGDLVYCLRGATFGKTAFITPYSEGAIASSLMIIRPHIKEIGNYIYRYLISPFGRSQIFRFDNGSAQPNLSANSVTIYAFPLPPLAEQHRIVAKVDELMTLCDRLKASLQTAQSTQLHLADNLVEAAIH